MHVLADLDEEDGQTRVLAYRYPLPRGDFRVLQKLPEHFFACRRYFFVNGLRQPAQDVLVEVDVRVDKQLLHCGGNICYRHFPHRYSLYAWMMPFSIRIPTSSLALLIFASAIEKSSFSLSFRRATPCSIAFFATATASLGKTSHSSIVGSR